MELSAYNRAVLIKNDLDNIVYYAQKALECDYTYDAFDRYLLDLDIFIDSYKDNKKAFNEGR